MVCLAAINVVWRLCFSFYEWYTSGQSRRPFERRMEASKRGALIGTSCAPASSTEHTDGSEVCARVVRHSQRGAHEAETPEQVLFRHKQHRERKHSQLFSFRERLLKRVAQRERARKASERANLAKQSYTASRNREALLALSSRAAHSVHCEPTSRQRQPSRRGPHSSRSAQSPSGNDDSSRNGSSAAPAASVPAPAKHPGARAKRQHNSSAVKCKKCKSSAKRAPSGVTASDQLPHTVWHSANDASTEDRNGAEGSTNGAELGIEHADLGTPYSSAAATRTPTASANRSPHTSLQRSLLCTRGSVSSSRTSSHSPKERERLTQARFAGLSERVREAGIELPALCACGHTSETNVLDPTYPSKCAKNCPLRDNNEQYLRMLSHVLHAFGFELP